MKNPTFTVFPSSNVGFSKAFREKTKKVKTVFASILIPKCVFSKTQIQNILNHRIQFITKIVIFRKIKTSCNTKTLWKQFRTFWFFTRFDPITHLQYHVKKTWKYLQNNIFSVNLCILKSHGNGQSGGSFGRSVRCGFVVSVVLHEFVYSPSPLKIDAT